MPPVSPLVSLPPAPDIQSVALGTCETFLVTVRQPVTCPARAGTTAGPEGEEGEEQLSVFSNAALLCECLTRWRRGGFEVTGVWLVSPPALNRSATWKMEPLIAVWCLSERWTRDADCAYLIAGGQIYGSREPTAGLPAAPNRFAYVLDSRGAEPPPASSSAGPR